MSVHARLRRFATESPRSPAFTITSERGVTELDYGTLHLRVRAFAYGLEARGIGPGDRVALSLTTSPELVALVIATQSLRAVPFIVNPALPPSAVARRAALVGARVIVDEALASVLAGPSENDPLGWATASRPAELAFLQLTSGTAGESRAAAISYGALEVYLEGSGQRLEMRPGDVLVGWVPLHHDLGLVRFLFTPIWFGLHCHLLPPALSSLGPWVRTIAAQRATITAAPDFAYRLAARMAPEVVDLGCLRVATNGGEPVRASTIAAFEARFNCAGAIRPGYGLAEATLGVSACAPNAPLKIDAKGHVSCGSTVPGIELRVARDGLEQPRGSVGDLEIRGPALFAGYFDPGAPGGFDRTAFDADEWFSTGDTGYVDGDGEVFVLGRTRAMVKQAGALMAPREVEEVADAVPGVRLSAAIGLPNAHNDAEELVLVVEAETKRGAAHADKLAQAVQEAVRGQIGVTPGRVMVVPARSIPITANGKIRHAALREQLARGARQES